MSINNPTKKEFGLIVGSLKNLLTSKSNSEPNITVGKAIEEIREGLEPILRQSDDRWIHIVNEVIETFSPEEYREYNLKYYLANVFQKKLEEYTRLYNDRAF